MPEEAYVRTEERDGVTVVSFPDDSALDAARVEQIQRELYAIVEACGHGIIVLDFSEERETFPCGSIVHSKVILPESPGLPMRARS